VLAKLANRIAKKSEKARGVLDLYQSPHQRLALERTAVADVWGIGRASATKLYENNILTALDLRDTDLRWIRKELRLFGAKIVTELRGTKVFSLELNPPPRRSMVCTRSFGKAITDYRTVREAVAVFTSRVAEKLRSHNLAAHSITTILSTHRFNAYPEYYSNASTYSSTYPTDVDQELQAWAFGCLDKIFKQGFEYHKAGVMLGGLVPSDKLTTRMYDDERWERFRRVMRAVDEINRRWGKDTVRFVVARPNGEWLGRCYRHSPRYTTRLNEILAIRPFQKVLWTTLM
jgi:DNA polymerase V